MIRWKTLLAALLLVTFSHAQKYPQGYFGSPLDTALYLSAPFGALRANHFHSGIDIRTFGKEGRAVLAAADGQVVRIKVSPFGYGKALYIDHPNGYTTVYAHLQRFAPIIDSIVKAEQYRRQVFDVELFPAAGKYKFKKGDTIALSGNSGGSTGPHLHFEIRDTRTEEIINPLLFGMNIPDYYPPSIDKNFLLYEQNDSFKHLYGNYPYVSINTNTLKNKWRDTLKVKPGDYLLAANANDAMNERVEMDVNYLQLKSEGKELFNFSLERFAFDETRMVNCHIDYALYASGKGRWHKCFVDDGNQIGFYSPKKKTAISVLQGEAKPVTLKALDLAGFADSVSFILFGDDTQPSFTPRKEGKKTPEEYAYPGNNNIFNKVGYSFTIPKGALYDTIAVTTKKSTVKRKGLYADYISILHTGVPLQKEFSVSIRPNITKETNTDKLVVVRLVGKGLKTMVSEGGSYKNGTITATTRMFGIFSVALDNQKPTIDRFKQKDDIVAVRITDALSGIDSYRATINGEWWLMEYDAKDDLLWGVLPAGLASGKHELKIIVTDNRKNSATFTHTIERP